ncbi:nucleotidyltransferase domain-containing protein [Vampirovibrio chlorellavorus]|uniref:nucleotidyltransferase domain-containing protein n=1 Tax=Vampirovibrio chlorellavorus TaxID=758823 RepID=UPI0026F31370|nr:nucleotidyltransferase domain-containing protein [Vampirovibrio chlorellavorus]
MSLMPLFPSPVLVDVLCLFLTHPDSRYYQREIAETTGHSLLQVQHALGRIEKTDLIAQEKSGNRVYYQAKQAHPAFQDLQQAFLKTDAMATALKVALEPLDQKVKLAFIFGSLAKGNATAESDIDLFLLGDVSLKSLSQAMADSTDNLKREFNPVIMTVADYRQRLQDQNRFAIELMETPKIWLKGTQDEFTAMVE